MEPEGHLS